MWPFSRQKQYLVLHEEYENAREDVVGWYVVLIIALLVLLVFASLFVGGVGTWTLVPTALSFLVLSRASAAVTSNKTTIAQYLDQKRQVQIERKLREED